MVKASGSRLTDLRGVGPVVAARVLADVGDVARFADRNRFASWTGTAPIEASSGEIVRHRLSRAGNRRMNHMIHIAATTQIRLDTDGRAYYRRKLAAGKTRAEAMRCLKRRISDALYRQLLADAKAAQAAGLDTGPGGHCGATLQSSAAGSHPHTGTSDQPLPGPAPTTLLGRHDPCEPPPGLGFPANAPTRRSRQGGAPHRTNDLDGDKRRRTLQRADPGILTTEGSRTVGCRVILSYGRGVHPWAAARFGSARVARLATVTASGRPHVVPVVFVVVEDLLWTAVDAKSKSTRHLARLANIRANPAVSVLVDHYGEDWSTLWWVRAEGTAQVLEAVGGETSLAVPALAAKYPQYAADPPLGPFIRVRLERWRSWSA